MLAKNQKQEKDIDVWILSFHCTGLCKDCEGPQLNLDSLTKFMRKFCRCRSKLCPKWICSCDLDENGGSQGTLRLWFLRLWWVSKVWGKCPKLNFVLCAKHYKCFPFCYIWLIYSTLLITLVTRAWFNSLGFFHSVAFT